MSFDTSIQTTRSTDPPIWRDTVPNRSIRQTDSHPFDFERSSVNFKGFHLRAGSLSLSLSLKKFDRDILIACAKNTKGEVSRRKRRYGPRGAERIKENQISCQVLSMQIFFLIQTYSKHVTSAAWKQRSAMEARRVSRERPFPPPMDNRISNSRRQIS